MKRAAQLKFSDPRLKKELSFGGTLMKKAKNRHARPVSSKDPMHLVLRSTQAKGTQSFRHPAKVKPVRMLVDRHCRKYGVKMIEFSNNGNHLHLMVKFPSRAVYLRFIRSLTGAIALLVTGANKFKGLKKKFWDFRPFTRVVVGQRGYRIARDYVVLNQLEELGMIPHRENRLKGLSPPEAMFFLKN